MGAGSSFEEKISRIIMVKEMSLKRLENLGMTYHNPPRAKYHCYHQSTNVDFNICIPIARTQREGLPLRPPPVCEYSDSVQKIKW